MKTTNAFAVHRSWVLRDDMRCALPALAQRGLRVHAVVTDAPYHLASIVKRMGRGDSAPIQHGTDGMFRRLSEGFMGETWDDGDIAQRPDTWRLCLEMLHPGGFCVVFTGPDYDKVVTAMREAGFVMHRMMGWLFGSGVPKGKPVHGNRDVVHGRDSLRPALEPIAIGQRPRTTPTWARMGRCAIPPRSCMRATR